MFTHMDYIYEVYKEKSFSNAAKNLFISQSSLSLTIKRAEEKIGMPVFDRSTYPIQLTEFGMLYINAVEEIHNITSQLTDYIYDVNHLRKGHLSVGSGNFFSTYYVAPAISSFKEKYPNISVNLMEGRTLDLEPMLANGNLDILVTNATLDTSVYHKYHLFDEELILVIPKKYLDSKDVLQNAVSYKELSQDIHSPKKGISLNILSDIPFISMRQGNDLKKRTTEMFKNIDLIPNKVLELDQTSTAFRLACTGMGACIVGNTVIQKLGCPPDIFLFYIDHPKAHREVAIYTKNVDYISRTSRKFIDIMLQQN